MMQQNQRLAYCEKCTKRAFLPSSGMVCGLNNQKPSFETHCPDFTVDQAVERNLQLQQEERLRQTQSNETFGLSKIGISNKTLAGIIMIIGAVVWFIGGLIWIDTIFFYPPILFVLGLITLVKGLGEVKISKARKPTEDVLDEI